MSVWFIQTLVWILCWSLWGHKMISLTYLQKHMNIDFKCFTESIWVKTIEVKDNYPPFIIFFSCLWLGLFIIIYIFQHLFDLWICIAVVCDISFVIIKLMLFKDVFSCIVTFCFSVHLLSEDVSNSIEALVIQNRCKVYCAVRSLFKLNQYKSLYLQLLQRKSWFITGFMAKSPQI